jgi:hypothetical protein
MLLTTPASASARPNSREGEPAGKVLRLRAAQRRDLGEVAKALVPLDAEVARLRQERQKTEAGRGLAGPTPTRWRGGRGTS